MQKLALVTGSSGGIGSAIVELFVSHQIKVLTPDLDELDLLNKASIERYLSSLKLLPDILINSAGINPLAETTEIKDSDLDDIFGINLFGPIFLMRGLLPSMMKNNYGRIVSISSIWSLISKPKRVLYAATKAALNAVTRTAALETGKHNILINAVAPGFVNTELTKKNNTDEEIKKIAANIPLQRLAEPNEIAELVYFLSSDKNTYISGQTIFIDGGYTSQ
jgi:3-oxoacyl-[acyl-carrier protein] reductase